MKTLLVIAGALAVLILAVVTIGYSLPVQHTAARERVLRADPARVFAAITTPSDFPSWRRGVQRVEALPPLDGKARFREIGSDGAITYVYEEQVPGQRLVSRIADDDLPFGGRWIFELSAASEGTRLRVTEQGEVYNPIFRFVSRFIFGHDRSLEQYLADLEAHLRSPAG